jgi:hypothetical protein
MIHENFKSGGTISQEKGHDQELIVTLICSKCSLGNVLFLHTYLVVAKIKIMFGKSLRTTQFIQNVINDRGGKFVFDCDYAEGMKIGMHVPSSFFIEYHDYWRRTWVGTWMNNICF